jgi:hypothetical protein
MAGKVTCPNCSDLGVVFVLDVNGKKVQVACGHSVCTHAREDQVLARIAVLSEARDSARGLAYANTDDLVRRVVAEVSRHLPRMNHARTPDQGPRGR